MFIHFTFGSLAKENKIQEQTKNVIELILKEKKLKPSECPEFVPAFPDPRGRRIPLGDLKVENDKVVIADIDIKEELPELLNTPPDRRITYLPTPVRMLCFIRTSFNQLATSPHSRQYGKFGIILTNSYLKKKGIQPVEYYTKESVWTNTLIKKWNYYTRNNLYPEKHKELQDEIVNYRKPATLFPSFLKLTTIEVNRTPEGLTAKHYTYDRYPEGYDFTKEKEYRIIFDEAVNYLYFSESDLYMVITPDIEAKSCIKTYLNQAWTHQPRVEVFPS